LSKPNLAIRHLDLSYNTISDLGGVLLATALCENTSLSYFNISKNNLGDPTGKVINKNIRDNRVIQYLNMDKNEILPTLIEIKEEVCERNRITAA
jgi:hypothetical protein